MSTAFVFSKSFMIVAGEPSGDILAAELVKSLQAARACDSAPPKFFGAGGPAMAKAGVELLVDLTQFAIFGISDILKHYLQFRRIFQRLLESARTRQPDGIILVDYSGFNLRLARAIKRMLPPTTRSFYNWTPKVIYYVSPQVWASRPGRVRHLRKNVDLVLSIFPFEKEWYASRAPDLPVEFVGHPIVDRYSSSAAAARAVREQSSATPHLAGVNRALMPPLVLLLPGSRKREIEAHLPVMIKTVRTIMASQPIRLRMVLPNPELVKFALSCIEPMSDLEIQTAKLAESLGEADLAIAASGTVTMECAYFGLPTIVVYITSTLTYQIARRIISVRHIAMPNIMAGEAVYPEFIQQQVQPDALAKEAMELLNNSGRRIRMKSRLATLVNSLGPPGASQRAAEAIGRILPGHSR